MSVPGQSAYPLPADYLRMVTSPAPDTPRPFPGNGLGGNRPSLFTLKGNRIVLLIDPETPRGFPFDYISSKFVVNAGDGELKTEFSNDADGYVFDSRLVTNYLKVKFLETKGFDTTAALSDFNRSLDNAMGADGMPRRLSLNAGVAGKLIGWENVGSGTWDDMMGGNW